MTQADSNIKEHPRKRINGWLLFAVILGILILVNYRPAVDGIVCTDEVLATDPDVIMLGTWWCPYCAEARRYFHDNEVHYCEFDIERSEEGKRRYEEADGRSIPLLIFDQRYRYEGFDEAIVERALAMLEEEKRNDDR